MKNIRLLHLIKSLDIGGIERTTINYSNELSKNFEFVGIFANKGIFNHSNLVSKRVKLLKSLVKITIYTLPIQFPLLIYLINKNKINVIHYHHRIFIPLIFFLKIIFRKIKIIYTHHSNFDDFINKLIIADKILSISQITENDIKKYKPNSKTIRIEHQIPTILNIINNLDNNKIAFGYVGRIEKNKGIDEVLDLFLRINKSTEKDKYNFYFFGNGNYLKTLKKMINKNGLTNYKIVTSEWDLSKIYGSIDIVIYPTSKIEGYGMVILEAINFGKIIFIKNNSLVSFQFDSNLINYYDNINELVDKIERNTTVFYQHNGILVQNEFEKCIISYLKVYSI